MAVANGGGIFCPKMPSNTPKGNYRPPPFLDPAQSFRHTETIVPGWLCATVALFREFL